MVTRTTILEVLSRAIRTAFRRALKRRLGGYEIYFNVANVLLHMAESLDIREPTIEVRRHDNNTVSTTRVRSLVYLPMP